MHGPGSAASCPSPTSASWTCLWFHREPIPLPGASATWLICAAAGGVSRRAGSLDPVSRRTFPWRWRWVWSRPRLGTTPIALGLQSPCPPGHGIGQLADLIPKRAGSRELGGVRVILGRVDPPTGRLQAPASKGALGVTVSLRWVQARFVGGRRVSNGSAAGEDLLHRSSPSWRPRRRVLGVCHSGPGALGCGRWPDAHGVWWHRRRRHRPAG